MERIPAEELNRVVMELADLLGEKYGFPIMQIRKIVQLRGVKFARELYDETRAIEDQGGMMLPDNSRRRTPGGVYFVLARSKITDEQRQIIFPSNRRQKKGNQSPIAAGVPLFSWKERIPLIQSLILEQGDIKSMKVSLVGRPGRIEKRPEVVVTTMSYVAKLPNLPRGIPTPPDTPTLYAVYIAPKQWEKVEEALTDPQDNLMVEGICAFDPETNGMAVFASSVLSEQTESKRRGLRKPAAETPQELAKPAQPKPVAPAATAPNAGKSPKKSRIAAMSPEPVAAVLSTVDAKYPPEVAHKLNELYASAALFKQKIANIQIKPAGQQFGLEMTQKLLKNVEDEIAALEKKYS